MATKTEAGANLTLIRGKSYTMVHPFDRRKGAYQFERGVPSPVLDPKVVAHAMTLTEVVSDGEDEYEKPLFRKTPLETEQKGSTSRRAAAVDDEDEELPTRKTGVRRRKL